MTPLLNVALRGLNPDRVRNILASGKLPPPAPVEAAWPIEGIEFQPNDGLPRHLSELPDAPPWLFVRGRLPDRLGVAVVGSRRATRYGLDVACEIGARLGAAGWPVVSGLALGVDAAAHRGCVDAGGKAVAVLGCGIDRWYPRRNRQLGEDVVRTGGAVVSEFGPGVDPEPWRFPYRNRIIAGLSGLVIVVEAAERSGALITANQALAQGRDVAAIPGDLNRATSRGCNRLIRDGAHPVVDLDDLVELVEMSLGPAPARPRERTMPSSSLGDLPATVDELIERSGLSPGELMVLVAEALASGEVTISEGLVRPAPARNPALEPEVS